MIFISKKHEKRFKKACEYIDKTNREDVVAVYLLTAKKRLWNEVKPCFGFSELDMDLCAFEPRTLMEQALFNAAHDICHFTDAVILRELADPDTIPNDAFTLIVAALIYMRVGFEFELNERDVPEYV